MLPRPASVVSDPATVQMGRRWVLRWGWRESWPRENPVAEGVKELAIHRVVVVNVIVNFTYSIIFLVNARVIKINRDGSSCCQRWWDTEKQRQE